jgi:hypothetical protein
LGSKVLDGVISEVFPLEKNATERQQKNRDNVIGLVKAIYNNENNAKNYGYNGWSMVNAIGEYLDHYRGASVHDRAVASMDSNSWVTRAKLKAQDYLLSAV